MFSVNINSQEFKKLQIAEAQVLLFSRNMSNLDFDTNLSSSSLFSGGSPSSPGGSPLDEMGGAGGNAELQEFIAMEQQKQQLRATVICLNQISCIFSFVCWYLISSKKIYLLFTELGYPFHNSWKFSIISCFLIDSKFDGHVLGEMYWKPWIQTWHQDRSLPGKLCAPVFRRVCDDC